MNRLVSPMQERDSDRLRAARWLAAIVGGAALCALAASALWTPAEIASGDHVAWMGATLTACTGCDACGLSRAFSAMTHLDTTDALHWNTGVLWAYPLAWLAAVAGPWFAWKGGA